ncbi:MAG: hypothetical protein L3J39_18915 [Verrucomicrobiales bacterium]|nr:hypothetical protein [Verrucomicrobiales bacterium]
MSQSISTPLVLAMGGMSLLTSLNRQNSVISEGGRYVRDQACRFLHYSTQPFVLDTRRHSALVELQDLLNEHSTKGWDGIEAPALSALTLETTKMFLAALPADIPDPDFAVEPDDGAISLEWYGGYRKIASVSISESRRLAYAALRGTDVSNGAYHFSDEQIPEPVLTGIRGIIA